MNLPLDKVEALTVCLRDLYHYSVIIQERRVLACKDDSKEEIWKMLQNTFRLGHYSDLTTQHATKKS